MRSYIALEEIKKEYQKDYIQDFEYEKAIKILSENFDKISQALESDFKIITGNELVIYDSKVYLDDEDFRQGATAYFFRGKFAEDENYLINIECLLDFDKIGIKNQTEPKIEALQKLNQAILSKSNSEGFAELRNL
ncbi:TPA: hypothetical protein ACT5CK_002337 [Flavobacterium psychrophilum]|nr:hypothetical protein [Flavobacterium psychrophilum]QZK98794.1 hypothetical protein K5L05_03655 [Flavobacterium psychrophilum]QZK98798.1 hypothetical protein K5L05_03675 [Flavobacterium psychrophilum]SNB95513.1 hypothetical protein FPC840_1450003 [Flavobacterium psychrophilum]GAQ50204.1 hypothetical protein FPK15_contig00151-0001 [Flavobacterium psychrophilum]GAW90769.1 hypothetical protein FPS14_contig00105-0004 [Flavobacterium psychrophilum]